MSDTDLAPLLHALGLDERHEDPWRDYYVTGATAEPEILELVARGLMEERRAPGFLAAGDRVFGATPTGRTLAIATNKARRLRVSRGARRYLRWLEVADAVGVSFGEYLRRGLDREAGRSSRSSS